MHNIYSLHTFYCVFPTCFSVTFTIIVENLMYPLGKTTCCYAAIVSGYCHDTGNSLPKGDTGSS